MATEGQINSYCGSWLWSMSFEARKQHRYALAPDGIRADAIRRVLLKESLIPPDVISIVSLFALEWSCITCNQSIAPFESISTHNFCDAVSCTAKEHATETYGIEGAWRNTQCLEKLIQKCAGGCGGRFCSKHLKAEAGTTIPTEHAIKMWITSGDACSSGHTPCSAPIEIDSPSYLSPAPL